MPYVIPSIRRTAITILVVVNFACSDSPSGMSDFLGLPPIATPSGVLTYLFFKNKKVRVPINMAIEAARKPHLNAERSLIPSCFTSPKNGQINCPKVAPTFIPR